ncbi:unnamed protein product [Oikopleura dioica]|uniref:GOLD domain-containing protein n=1 Tax=Oikopleura dioica TaxID=34765 RepID=E4Y3N1_OIKDI|nr:unnamed protein product [Oikopleura dioica]
MYTVIVPAGKTECYYHVTNETFHFEYTVEGGGALDIRFEAFDHKEESLIKVDKNTTGYHLFKMTEMAPTKFC